MNSKKSRRVKSKRALLSLPATLLLFNEEKEEPRKRSKRHNKKEELKLGIRGQSKDNPYNNIELREKYNISFKIKLSI